jgi:hypothetical protein
VLLRWFRTKHGCISEQQLHLQLLDFLQGIVDHLPMLVPLAEQFICGDEQLGLVAGSQLGQLDLHPRFGFQTELWREPFVIGVHAQRAVDSVC